MYNVNEELKEKIINLNKLLLDKYREIFSLDGTTLRNFIQREIGEVKKINRLSQEELSHITKREAYWGSMVPITG